MHTAAVAFSAEETGRREVWTFTITHATLSVVIFIHKKQNAHGFRIFAFRQNLQLSVNEQHRGLNVASFLARITGFFLKRHRDWFTLFTTWQLTADRADLCARI